MKKIAMFLLSLQIVLPAVFANEPSWQRLTAPATDLRAILTDPKNPDIILIGAKDGVFKSCDGGKTWKMILNLPHRNKGVNVISFAEDGKSLYIATACGLYFSADDGRSFKRVFQGRNYLEEDCAVVLVLQETVFIGTRGGLFFRRKNAGNWDRGEGRFSKENILAVSGSRRKDDAVYIVSVSGVFKGPQERETWERIFVSVPKENEELEEVPDDMRDGESQSSKIRDVVVDAQKTGVLYLGTLKGVYKSLDQGSSWLKLTDYGLLTRAVDKLFLSPKGELYAVTKSGIFVYKEDRWFEVSLGLAAKEVRGLAWDNHGNIYTVTDSGLFRWSGYTYRGREDSKDTLNLCPNNEPSIRNVQEKAAHYAEVEPQKIISWRKKAAMKAWLPKLTAGVNRNTTDLWHWEGGTTTKADDDVLRRGRDSVEWDVSLSWDLGGLIWSDDQTNIDVRSRLMVELRDDILDEVTKVYFERLRVKADLDELALEDRKKRADKELRIAELTASLDALTDGYFSRELKSPPISNER
ncbi:MAG: hypothetical protein NTU54_06780 [Candidatus Omnitrophica bacterium]|nr:hypothetical protein [Candidatus Omnitrophota bacterium]